MTVLERSDAVAASWRGRYDGLRLNTTGWMSTMPGFRATKRKYGEFPTRDSWVRYLEDYAMHHGIDVRFGIEVRAITRVGGRWAVETENDTREADVVVVATGYDREPDLPDWPGREGFTGELIHSSEYRNAEPYRGLDVLVVGPGTTGSEIAHFVAEGGARRVRVASRTAPNVLTRKFLGSSVNVVGILLNRLPLPIADRVGWVTQRLIFGKLDRYGLPRSPEGVATNLVLRQRTPAYDSGFVADVKSGRVEIVPGVLGFDGDHVILADGSRIQPEVVIAATGYRRGLSDLVGHLGVLDDSGRPVVKRGAEHPDAPGLFFNGYEADLSGQLRLMRFGARAIAKAAART